jgi:hypothetical protein
MLVELPPEIIVNIANNLKPHDIVEFMKTCRQVNSLIPSSCPYREITIVARHIRMIDTCEAIKKTIESYRKHG